MKKQWHGLTQHQQKVYKDKAAYLIDRGCYAQGKTVEELAKEIYEKVVDILGKLSYYYVEHNMEIKYV